MYFYFKDICTKGALTSSNSYYSSFHVLLYHWDRCDLCVHPPHLSTWVKGCVMGVAILSFRGRPFFFFSTTSPPSISRSGFLLLNDKFLLMTPILSSLSLLVSSLDFTSFSAEMFSFGLLDQQEKNPFALGIFPLSELWSSSHVLCTSLVLLNHLSKCVSPVVEEMAVVIPGVAFDLSVNLESKAFIGSILDAEVSSRQDLTLERCKNRK